LDEVFSNYYEQIATADTDETWANFDSADSASFGFDTSNFKEGNASRQIEVDNGYGATYKEINADLSAFNSFVFDVYIDNIDNLLSARVMFGEHDSSSAYSFDLTDDLKTGWNSFKVHKDDAIIIGVEPNWSAITDVTFLIETQPGEILTANIDNIRLVDTNAYPQRVFDNGLNTIPVAWWAGNTALFEIKTAAEAEGARFFADEQGRLIYQNRQHYNVNDEFKMSRYGFNFNNSTDLLFIGKISEVINSVVVSIKPRIIQSETEIWRYANVPVQIGASEVLTVWASFNDPVPEAGLETPVATTDYTGNSQSDGSGSDRTSDISITITKFATAAKLEIKNTSGSSLYLTMLKLRGTPAAQQSEINIFSKDDDSVSKYGELPAGGFLIENKYLTDEIFAQTLADNLVEWYKNPTTRAIIKSRSIPQLQIGDMVGLVNSYTNTNYIMRITRIREQFTKDGYNAEYGMRSVLGFELLNYFTIGESEIEGTDVIAP
jgi:hypothetical protein